MSNRPGPVLYIVHLCTLSQDRLKIVKRLKGLKIPTLEVNLMQDRCSVLRHGRQECYDSQSERFHILCVMVTKGYLS